MKELDLKPHFEARWPGGLAVLAVVCLLAVLPGRISLFPAWVPYVLGIAMILIGLVSLSIALFERRRDLKGMRKLYPDMPHSSAGVVAALIAGLGILALLLAIFRQ